MSTNKLFNACKEQSNKQNIASFIALCHLYFYIIQCLHVTACECERFADENVSQNVYNTPSSDLQTAKSEAAALNFQSRDGLDFHCILYQAKSVVNLILWFSVPPHAKSSWNMVEMDCVADRDKMNNSVAIWHSNIYVTLCIKHFNMALNTFVVIAQQKG